jgi:RHS repeat-associated protein
VPNRHGSSNSYRYGFQGQEKDDELKGEGNSYNFGARIYDPRLGRFCTIDPDDLYYPNFSPYSYGGNNPVFLIDFDGRGPIIPESWWKGRPDLAYFAGMADAAFESGQGMWDLAVEAFWLSENPDEWEKRYGKVRREQYDAVLKIFTDKEAAGKFMAYMAENIKVKVEKLSGAKGEDVEAYEQGKLMFEGITLLVGVEEINLFLKSGRFSDDALRVLWKSAKYKPNTTSLVGRAKDIDLISSTMKVVNNKKTSVGYSRLSNNKAWEKIIKKHAKIKDDAKRWKLINDEWWTKHNAPWLDKIIARGDKIKVVSKRTSENLINADGSPTHFAREIKYLESKGYIQEGDYFVKRNN